jgi:hypothetical protein|nr:MAG TPA: hypothetical protein [Caudoviricetes sp.]DAO83913.1 MAG TPA: hypothetical protein [Caudoviricetes sp.]
MGGRGGTSCIKLRDGPEKEGKDIDLSCQGQQEI